MTPDAPKRKRASRPKVRSGCVTCRIRRVKCDERKPSCLKCLNFSGVCNGYARPPHVSPPEPSHLRTLVPKNQPNGTSISRQPRATIFATESEHRFFHLFVAKTAHSISGFFDSEIWNRIVLQACQNESSIRHAVIAIGALDMTTMTVRDFKARNGCISSEKDEAAIGHHQFALQHYSKAIACMREAVARGTQPLRTTLLACMLIVCFETYHGDHKAALSQIQAGLGLIVGWFRSKSLGSGTISSNESEIIEDEIYEAFGRLDTQVMTFPDSRPLSDHEEMMKCHADALAAMPQSFPSIRTARFYSDIIMRRLMHFRIFHADTHRDTMAQAVGSNEAIADPTEEMKLELAKYMSDLERWRSAFDPLMSRLLKFGREKEYLSGLCLDVHNLNNSTSLAGTLGKDQMRFDRFLPQYKAIVSKCRILLADLKSSFSSSFLFDVQCIMPLYIVGRKCRDPVVRREAIALLLMRSWREGVWDSILAGKIARWVMEIEEEGIREDGFVPEWSRVRGAEVNFDLKERSAQLRCLRRVSQESEEMAVKEVEITW